MYIAWMIHGAANGIIVWFVIYATYGPSNVMSDRGLFALGDLAFSLGILWTNWKCLVLETRYKTVIVGVALVITVGGWWAWNGFMGGVYGNNISPYDVKGGFGGTFGDDWNWWAGLVLALCILIVGEMVYGAAKRGLMGRRMWKRWRGEIGEGTEVGVWQEMERDEGVREVLRGMAGEEAGVEVEGDGEVVLEEVEIAEMGRGRRKRWLWARR